MAKLQELSFSCPSGERTDEVTFLDLLFSTRLSNSACQTILSKLLASLLRSETSETLRRRYNVVAVIILLFHVLALDKRFDVPL